MDIVLNESLIGVLAPPPEDYSNSETASCLVDPGGLNESLIGVLAPPPEDYSSLLAANVSKRYDQQAPAAISHQAKFRVAVLSIYALYQFINGIDLDLDNHDAEQTETTEEANVPSRYYCYQCRQVVSVTVDVKITCSLCQGGWIQECGGVDKNVSGHVARGPNDSSLEQGLRDALSIDANIVTDRPYHGTRVTISDWIFSVTGFGIEAVSAFLDQVSTPRKPHYALYGMLLSILAVLVCILDLVHYATKQRGVPSASETLWGILPEVFGLALACIQCISSALQFSFLCRHDANPVKVSLVPFLFFFVLLAFKYRNGRN